MYNLGMFDYIFSTTNRTTVMEIGPGYGAPGKAILEVAPGKFTYIVVDLLFMLLFSGCYILNNIPDAKIFVYDPSNNDHQTLNDSIF